MRWSYIHNACVVLDIESGRDVSESAISGNIMGKFGFCIDLTRRRANTKIQGAIVSVFPARINKRGDHNTNYQIMIKDVTKT